MSIFRPKALSEEEQEQLIREAIAWLTREAVPFQIVLFGSGARFEMNESSDLDLLVLLETGEEVSTQRARVHSRPRTFEWPCDLHLMTRAEFAAEVERGGWARLVKNEGVVVFENGESTRRRMS